MYLLRIVPPLSHSLSLFLSPPAHSSSSYYIVVYIMLLIVYCEQKKATRNATHDIKSISGVLHPCQSPRGG